jgi:hypothetical protein
MGGGPLRKQPWTRPVSLADVVALVELVRESAVRGARGSRGTGLDGSCADSGHRNPRVPQLAPTMEEEIVDYSRYERRRLTVTQILITLAYTVGFIFVVMARPQMGALHRRALRLAPNGNSVFLCGP